MATTRPPLMPPSNETEHSISRITREGKKITYKLSVIQQPERARACGAGAKSSADRRPVDPPPVVELRIYESDPNNDMHKTDITFAYNANFFLFATLDTARPIAQGRVSGHPPTCPVLTGVPVAGIAYLDRPAQAGYFIFPDLSVRHEGRYRLNFNLYEEVKEPKDADKDAPLPPQEPIQPSMKAIAPQTYLHFRLEVKSIPFTVYSAKKFPGLATSTSLSRVVAEQGCRVRIRRDVRMRRRGDKQTKEYNEYDEERVYARSDRYSTPDAYVATPIERPRSTSNSTIDAPFAYVPDGQRRPSVPEYGYPQPYQQPPPPTPAPTTYQSHLTFGSTQTQYQTPQLPPTPQPPTAPAAAYSPHPAYAHVRRLSNAAESEPPVQGYPYQQPRPQVERFDYPKTSLPPLRLVDPPRPVNPQPYGEPRSSDPNAYQSSTQPSVPRARTPAATEIPPSLPPLKTLSGEYTSMPQSISAPQARNYDPVTGKRLLYDTEAKLTKRTHEDSFGHQERSLQNGMRPDAADLNAYPGRGRNGRKTELETAKFFEELGIERAAMEYRRADGTMSTKVTPVRGSKV
ncbi:hypothetical protein DTO063F5_6933 [Paecilomyces variotii]|nr:hypothetical protein DTO063F5_6933 [Paecilomyces variotii]